MSADDAWSITKSSPQQSIAAGDVMIVESLHKQAQHNEAILALKYLVAKAGRTLPSGLKEKAIIKTLVRLCNKYACRLTLETKLNEALDLFEYAKLLLESPLLQGDSDFESLKQCITNNLAVYSAKIGENELAVKFCRNAVQKEAETSLESQAVVYNNLSSLYFKHLEWKRAFRAQLKALKLIENQVFETIKLNEEEELKQSKKFKIYLQIMLQGYLSIGKCIEKLQNLPDVEIQNTYSDALNFYQNGWQLAKQFLGEYHLLTKQLKKALEKPEAKKIIKGSIKKQHSVQKLKEKQPICQDMSIEPSNSEESPKRPAFHFRIQTPHRMHKVNREFIINLSAHLNTSNNRSDSVTREDHPKVAKSSSFKTNYSVPTPVNVRRISSMGKPAASNSLRSIFASDDKKMGTVAPTDFFSQIEENLEEKIAKKVEETLQKRKSEQEGQLEQKKLEIESKITELRKENEEYLKNKLEKEAELEILKTKLKAVTDSFDTQSMSMSTATHARDQIFFPNPSSFSPSHQQAFFPQSVYFAPWMFYSPPMNPEMTSFYSGYQPHSYMRGAQSSPQYSPQYKSTNATQSADGDASGRKFQSPQISMIDLHKGRGNRFEGTNKNISGECTADSRCGGMQSEPSSLNQTPKYPISERQSQQFSPGQSDGKPLLVGKSDRKSSDSFSQSNNTQLANDEETGGPMIQKSETFGAAPLKKLMNDMKKPLPLKAYGKSRSEVPPSNIEVILEKSHSEASTTNHAVGSLVTSCVDLNSPVKITLKKKMSDVNPAESPMLSNYLRTVSLETHELAKVKADLANSPSLGIDMAKTQSTLANSQQGIAESASTQFDNTEDVKEKREAQELVAAENTKGDFLRAEQLKIQQSKSQPLNLIKNGKPTIEVMKSDLQKRGSLNIDNKSEQSPALSIHKENELGVPRRKGSLRRSSEFAKKESVNSSDMTNFHRIWPSYSKLDIELDEVSTPKDSAINEIFFNSLGSEFGSPRPFQITDLLELIKLPETSLLKQLHQSSDDELPYVIECQLVAPNLDSSLRLSLSQKILPHADSSLRISEETIPFKDLKTILELIEYRDVLPPSVTVKSVRTYKKFIQYFVLPFVWVVPGEPWSKTKRIEIRAKPRSLFTEAHECEYLGELCRLSVYHVGGTNIRIVLDSLVPETRHVLRFDMKMDQGSFEKFFEMKSTGKFSNAGETLLQVIETLTDDTAEAKDLDNAHEFIGFYGNERTVNHEFENCRFKGRDSESSFLGLLEEVMRGSEQFLKDKGMITMAAAADIENLKYFKFHVWDEKAKKNFAFIFEDVEKAEFKVHLKNFFETHAPEGKKVMAEGDSSYDQQRLWKDFGIRPQSADFDDKLALCSIISECFRLEVFEKKLEPIDCIAYGKNTVMRCPIEVGCFERIYKGPNFKYPVTFSLIGVQGHPIGVRATIYKPEDCSEHGLFYLLDPSCWKKAPNAETKKQGSRKVMESPMIEEYNLAWILKAYGFKIMHEYIEFEETAKKVDIIGVRLAGSSCVLDTLENPLSFENVIKYLKKNTELLEGFDEDDN